MNNINYVNQFYTIRIKIIAPITHVFEQASPRKSPLPNPPDSHLADLQVSRLEVPLGSRLVNLRDHRRHNRRGSPLGNHHGNLRGCRLANHRGSQLGSLQDSLVGNPRGSLLASQ